MWPIQSFGKTRLTFSLPKLLPLFNESEEKIQGLSPSGGNPKLYPATPALGLETAPKPLECFEAETPGRSIHRDLDTGSPGHGRFMGTNAHKGPIGAGTCVWKRQAVAADGLDKGVGKVGVTAPVTAPLRKA